NWILLKNLSQNFQGQKLSLLKVSLSGNMYTYSSARVCQSKSPSSPARVMERRAATSACTGKYGHSNSSSLELDSAAVVHSATWSLLLFHNQSKQTSRSV